MTGNFRGPQSILLIEDNPGDARLIEEMISEINQARDITMSRFELVWKKTLADGLERLRGTGIDLVLLDLTLPDSRGLETFARIADEASRIPVILLTGLSDEQLAMAAVRTGAQDYLQKAGLTSFYLAKAMRYALERKAVEAEIKILSQKILEVREEERSGLAHEIHDGLGQSLLALKLHLQFKWAKIVKQGGLPVGTEMDEIVGYLDEILQEVRTISHNLSPIGLRNLGFGQALRQLVSRFQFRDNIEILSDLDAVDDFFADNWDMNAYRVVEQALVNAVKHAQATRIVVSGRREMTGLTLSVRDNGRGIDAEVLRPGKKSNAGLGLHIMRERARMLGGSLQVVSDTGSGTEIRLEINRAS